VRVSSTAWCALHRLYPPACFSFSAPPLAFFFPLPPPPRGFSAAAPFSRSMGRVYAPTNGNRKKKNSERKAKTTRRRAEKRQEQEQEEGEKRVDVGEGKINSSSVRILLKANGEEKKAKEKAVHTDISMCLYLILCLSSERCYCRHPRSEPQSLPLPLLGGEKKSCASSPLRSSLFRFFLGEKTRKKTSRVLIRSENMCTEHCKRSFSPLFFGFFI
jgi:uncharacterized Zn finger protein (UPF0148 family)